MARAGRGTARRVLSEAACTPSRTRTGARSDARFALAATPFEYAFPAARTALVVIDMQRDFIEPGGFGASLGNDVTLLAPAIAPIAALLAAWRARGWPIVHTREAHRPDLVRLPAGQAPARQAEPAHRRSPGRWAAS